jgi:superfamily II DNA/RNA helicase
MGKENCIVMYAYMCTHSLLQESALHRGVDVVCATPGRLNDHFQRGNLVSKLQMRIVVFGVC